MRTAKDFFFEKKSKKLSSIAAGTKFNRENAESSETVRSFLILAVATCDPLFQKRTAHLPAFMPDDP